MKYCGRCKKELPLSSFGRRGKGKQPWCKFCKKVWDREYARTNEKRKKDLIKSKKKVYKRNRDYLNFLKKNSCCDCGKNFPPEAMDFHHLRDKNKNIAKLVTSSLEKIQKELSKCILLCSNCHRVRTFKK